MKFLTSLIITTCLIIGCQSQKKASNDQASSIENITSLLTDSSVVVSFQQTACYGTCPVQTITILNNGYATYLGERNVAQIGEYYAHVTPEQIQAIYTKAEELHFFDLEKAYTANMTDLPTTLISVATQKQQHSVSAYGDYPENLQHFIAFLGNDLQKIVWTKKR